MKTISSSSIAPIANSIHQQIHVTLNNWRKQVSIKVLFKLYQRELLEANIATTASQEIVSSQANYLSFIPKYMFHWFSRRDFLSQDSRLVSRETRGSNFLLNGTQYSLCESLQDLVRSWQGSHKIFYGCYKIL